MDSKVIFRSVAGEPRLLRLDKSKDYEQNLTIEDYISFYFFFFLLLCNYETRENILFEGRGAGEGTNPIDY